MLAKIDVDTNQRLAAAAGVQGIPAVKAVWQGGIVGEFTGAVPEPEVRGWIAELLAADAVALGSKVSRPRCRSAPSSLRPLRRSRVATTTPPSVRISRSWPIPLPTNWHRARWPAFGCSSGPNNSTRPQCGRLRTRSPTTSTRNLLRPTSTCSKVWCQRRFRGWSPSWPACRGRSRSGAAALARLVRRGRSRRSLDSGRPHSSQPGAVLANEDAERMARRICENKERLVGIVGPVKQDVGTEGFRAQALTR